MKIFTGIIVTVGAFTGAMSSPLFIMYFAIIFLLIYFGIVLPAIFLKDKEQRRDARAVLKLLLGFFRRQRR
jgi:hypothetical protein